MTNVVLTTIEKDPEVEAQRKGVYVMQSFRVPVEGSRLPLSPSDQHRGYEDGTTILWETLEDVEEYLQVLRDGGDDRPFEMRWNILCVEKVYFGPYSDSEVIGWWRATKQDNGSIQGYDLEKLDKCPFPGPEGFWDHVSNFTLST